jgi:hypothetical protein
MTLQTIIDLFGQLIDDTIDSDTALSLANNAKDKVEGERPWEFLKAHDATNIASTSGNYLTQYSLPSDFAYELAIALSLGSDYLTQIKTPFEYRVLHKDASGRYYLDMANSKISLCGTIAKAYILNIFYIKTTPDLTLATSPVWPRFHRLIAFDMADLWFAMDQGDKSRDWSPRWRAEQEILRQGMRNWDSKLKEKQLNQYDPNITNFSGYSIEG